MDKKQGGRQEQIGKELLTILAKGDASSFTALLLAVICALDWYRFRLMKQLKKKNEKIYKIIDKHSKNNITIIQALNGFSVTRLEIQHKL